MTAPGAGPARGSGLAASRSSAGRLVRPALWIAVGVMLAAGVGLWAHDRWRRIEVVSASMSPTISTDDTAWMDTSAAGGTGVEVGDIVVFTDPADWVPGDGPITKRVLAVGGQRLTCCRRDGRLERDGLPVDEPYLADGTRPSRLAFDIVVPSGALWVMGDNRDDSLDSRQHQLGTSTGFVPRASVVGVVVGR